MTGSPSRDRGFTLVELLVVIAVLGMLAAVVVFAVRGTTDDGTEAGCRTDRNQLITAQEMHYAQYGTYATEQELVDHEIIRLTSSLHDVELDGGEYTIVETGVCGGVPTDGLGGGSGGAGGSGGSGGAGGSGGEGVSFVLAVASWPSSAGAGEVLDPITVAVTDAEGAPASDPVDVSIAVTSSNPDAALAGTTTVASVDGTATFDDLTITDAGDDYAFTVSAADATSATSDPVTIESGEPVALAFTAQPTDLRIREGDTDTVVAIVDEHGNTVTDAPPTQITIAPDPESSPARTKLRCPSTRLSTVDGVATFPGCYFNQFASTHRFRATAAGFDAVVSEPVNVTGPPFTVRIVTEVADVVAGETFPPITVEVLDQLGNVVTAGTTEIETALFWTAEGFTGDGQLIGDGTVTAVRGVAVLDNVATGLAHHNQKMWIWPSGLQMRRQATNGFVVSTAEASHLDFTVEPPDSEAGVRWDGADWPTLEVRDRFDNRVEGQVSMTYELNRDAGDPAAELDCWNDPQLTHPKGYGRLAGCMIDQPGEYTITVMVEGLDPATSAPFDVS